MDIHIYIYIKCKNRVKRCIRAHCDRGKNDNFLRENRGFLADIWTPGKMRRKDGERGKNCKRKYTNAMIILNLREEEKKLK
jgi:hypothetical protein